ncbi:MAG: hypothetical protein WC941_00165 [Candidatus Bathyarchaeia archaeon]|jgi:hypothetical protein
MTTQVTLETLDEKLDRIEMRLGILEEVFEEVIIEAMPSARLSKEKIKEIKDSIQEMKSGKYATLEELRRA